MISNAVRDRFNGKLKEEFEEFLVGIYPLGELVQQGFVLVFNTGIPDATGEKDVVIDVGMYLNSIGEVCKYESHMVIK